MTWVRASVQQMICRTADDVAGAALGTETLRMSRGTPISTPGSVDADEADPADRQGSADYNRQKHDDAVCLGRGTKPQSRPAPQTHAAVHSRTANGGPRGRGGGRRLD